MNVFVSVYHVLRDLVLFPVNAIKNLGKSKEERQQLKKEKEKSEQTDLMSEAIKNATSLSGNDTSEVIKNVMNDGKGDKSDLLTFNYVVKDSYGKQIKSSFDAKSKSEVEAFLINEGYTIESIELKKKTKLDMEINFGLKFNSGDLSFSLTQLSTYIKAGIPLIDSVRILAKQATKPAHRKIYEKLVFDLVAGDSFSKALENQTDAFPRLLINMVKASEMTGDLSSTLDEMSDYYTSIEETKKQMISALTYPVIIFIFALIVIAFVLVWVVPNFVSMFEEAGGDIPAITQFTINASSFLAHYYIHIIVTIIIIAIAYFVAYRNIKSFRKAMQTFYMKLPVVGNVIIYNEVTVFTKTFAQLLNHSVHITDSMAILSKISNNEIYKEIIANTMNTLSKGGKISESFRGHWAFPVVAYEMLVTGESTGQLGSMMEKVSEHFNNLHKNAVNQIKSLIEPMTIILLAVAVGFILLSIFIPMFSLYNAVEGV